MTVGPPPGGEVSDVGRGVKDGKGVNDGSTVFVGEGIRVFVEEGGISVGAVVEVGGTTRAVPVIWNAASVIWITKVSAACV